MEAIHQGKLEGMALAEEKYRRDNENLILQMMENGLKDEVIVKCCHCTLEEIHELKKRL